MSAIVDDVYNDHSHVAGSFTMLASSRAHVGGSLNARALPGARVHTNFIGCLKKVPVRLYKLNNNEVMCLNGLLSILSRAKVLNKEAFVDNDCDKLLEGLKESLLG